MFDPSSFADPTPLAHADTSRTVLPRGGTSQCCITDRSLFNGVINDKPGHTNGETSYFQMCESRFCLQHQEGRTRVLRHPGEPTLAACILHRQTGPSPGVMVWGVIGYASRSPLVHIDGTLNSARYISGVLRPVALPFTRSLRNPTLQHDNARSHVAGIERTFLDTENVRLLPWPARSPDLSPIEKVWSMVAERLARHHTPVTTVDELWNRAETAWASVPVHTIQSLFDSMRRRISAVITARGHCSGYCFLRIYAP
ncbi:transposable element Tc1 transposase [Trichonephila clavipes]|nr:transposable element Tc1 transposase [Trichonephila clavipes]